MKIILSFFIKIELTFLDNKLFLRNNQAYSLFMTEHSLLILLFVLIFILFNNVILKIY